MPITPSAMTDTLHPNRSKTTSPGRTLPVPSSDNSKSSTKTKLQSWSYANAMSTNLPTKNLPSEWSRKSPTSTTNTGQTPLTKKSALHAKHMRLPLTITIRSKLPCWRNYITKNENTTRARTPVHKTAARSGVTLSNKFNVSSSTCFSCITNSRFPSKVSNPKSNPSKYNVWESWRTSLIKSHVNLISKRMIWSE